MPKSIIGMQPVITAPVTTIGKQINHYQGQVPNVVQKGTQAVKETVASGVRHLQQKKPQSVDAPKMRPELSTDTFSENTITAATTAKQPRKSKNNDFIHGDKNSMEEYFNPKTPMDEPETKAKWYEEVAKEIEEKEAEKAAKLAQEAQETKEYWQTLSQKLQEQKQEISDYFSKYFH